MNKDNLPEKDWERIVNAIDNVNEGLDIEFQSWLNKSNERLEIYAELISVRNNIKSLTPDDVEQKNQVWHSILLKIEKAENSFKELQFKRYRMVAVAAAVLVPLFFLGVGYKIGTGLNLNHDDSSYGSLMDFENSFEFGSQKAMLVLGNGNTVDLAKAKEVQEADGTRILNRSNTTLIYDVKSSKGAAELNTLIVPKGKNYQLLLSDGTKVYLNSNSMLRFPTSFQGKSRDVELLGEAYFEVKKNHNFPFNVKVKGIKLAVLGTCFNIDAYDSGEGISTTLVEGKVTLDMKDGRMYEIQPNEKVNYSIGNGSYTVERNVDVSLYTSWKDGVYRFENQRLESIMKRLSVWYSYEIVFTDDTLKGLKFTGVAERNKPIEELLNLMVNLKKLSYEVKNGVIFINKPNN